MNGLLTIRPAALADVAGIQFVAAATWKHTYGSVYSEEYIQSFLGQAYSTGNLEKAVDKDASKEYRRFLVAEIAGEVVGYAHITDPENGEAELMRIYILPKYQGKGIGRAFLCDFVRKDTSIKRLVAWVENENRAGTSFYLACGFQHEGSEEERNDGQVIKLNKYAKEVV